MTTKAIQNAAAIDAITMKLRGDTSHEVSDTILPNASIENTIANWRAQAGPHSRRRIRARVLSSCPADRPPGTGFENDAGGRVEHLSKFRIRGQNASTTAFVSACASPDTYKGHRSETTGRVMLMFMASSVL